MPDFPGAGMRQAPCNPCCLQALGTPDEEDWPGVRKLPDYHKVSFKQRARGARRNGALEAQGFQQKKSASRVARPEIPDLGSFSPMSQSLAWAFLPLNPGRRLGAAEASACLQLPHATGPGKALLHEFFQSAESDPTALLEGVAHVWHGIASQVTCRKVCLNLGTTSQKPMKGPSLQSASASSGRTAVL